ncbi:MAG: hypothetical protein ABWY66_12930 [Xanthobacteraceae bacterium]|jgi:hypothetical protein
MCMACEEMDIYYRYLDAIEEAKRRAQPWQCEVTVFTQDDDAKPAPVVPPKAAAQAASPFKCDDPE